MINRSKKTIVRSWFRKKGETSISAAGSFTIFIVCAIFLFQLAPVIIVQVQLNEFTNDIIRVAEVEGELNERVYDTISDLQTNRINAKNIDFSKTEFMVESNKRIQLNNRIVVSAEYTYKIQLGKVLTLPFKLKSTSDGFCETYWKE